MNTETVLASIVSGVTEVLKQVVNQTTTSPTSPTLYDLEAQTQAALPQIGQVILQVLTLAQGSGAQGPLRPCACGQGQGYHDQARPLTVQTSLGDIRLPQRAYYHCQACGTTSYPLDERLGLGQAGRMSRYLQEQCGWLLALLPTRVAQQTLLRFGWPPIAVSQIREHGEALGAELEAHEQAALEGARQEAAQRSIDQAPPRQPAQSQRLYAAPDGVMYSTTERDPASGHAVWRELKGAAVYEAEPAPEPKRVPASEVAPFPEALTARQRILKWLREQDSTAEVVPTDQAVRVSYVAQTGEWRTFGGRLWAELWARGLSRPVRELVVVADGAEHIDRVVADELRLPDLEVTRILDLAHAQQHVWAVSQAAFGPGSAAGRAWVQEPLTALERGQGEYVLRALEALAAEREQTAPDVAALARKTAEYVRRRLEQMAYPRFVGAGYQIGSGLAESACKRFGTDRMKGAGMRWTVQGAQWVATLRMFVLSDRWGEVSAYCRQAA
jgi:hypothetical protein